MRTAYLTIVSFVLLSGFTDHVIANEDHYLNEWTAVIAGGHERARDVAAQHGYTLVRELHNLPDHYILLRSDTPHRSKRGAHHHTRKLEDDHRVEFVQQQQVKRRDKRDADGRNLARAIVQSSHGKLDDPLFDHEWYINPTEISRRSEASPSLRVREVWKMGITGKGAVTSILDDGLERNHPDLSLNYDPFASYDYNDNDPDPSPRYDVTNENKHGTRCAGEIAMVANNEVCGVGVAFDSKVGGVRMLDGTVTDRLEAEALSFNSSHVDIYSVSWGPTDDGTKLEGPGLLAHKSLLKGIQEGRNGKGVLYVWASGNGGRVGDTCNADGYSSSIYTIGISSGSQFGSSPWYAERCSSTLTTAYSSGTSNEEKVSTTDLHNKCTDQHTGTSAAAPLGAGLLALLLEANPDLTWRDVQHIIVHTSRKEPLGKEDGWYTNAAGYCVSLKFGFGLLDALGMVTLGHKDSWQPVGDQHTCHVEAVDNFQLPATLDSGNMVEVQFNTTGCQGQDNEVNYLEHVILNLDLSYPSRGRISAELESPQGTIVTVMLERYYDKSKDGFNKWPLMSVHTWGEQPQGTWKFRVMDKTATGNLTGELKNATLTLYGTKEQPEYRKTHPKQCGPNPETTTAENVANVQSNDDAFDNVKSSENIVDLQERLRKMLKSSEDDRANRLQESGVARILNYFNL